MLSGGNAGARHKDEEEAADDTNPAKRQYHTPASDSFDPDDDLPF